MQPSGKPIRRTSASKRESERKGSKPGRSKTLAKHSGERRMYMSEGDIPRARHVRAVQSRPGRYPYPTCTEPGRERPGADMYELYRGGPGDTPTRPVHASYAFSSHCMA